MKNIYILDEHISSQKNGIGTFLSQLIYSLDSTQNNINIVSFNADSDEFNIVTDENQITRFLFPMFKRGHFANFPKIIDKFFKLHIPDSRDNIFFLNHSPCNDLTKSLKDSHPLSVVIFTIHDLGWTGSLLGNVEEYIHNISNRINGDDKSSYILKTYDIDSETYCNVDRVICLSDDTYSLIKNNYNINPDKLSLIPNGLVDLDHRINDIDIQTVRLKKRISSNEKILLFIGRPTKEKGLFDLIEAFKNLIDNYKDIKLVVVGDGNEASMKELIKASSDIASSIIYTGQLEEKELLEWISISDIGVISSYYEQCSYTAIEMLRHGLPIVASDGLGIRNMLIDNVNAIIANIGNRKRPEEYQENLKNAIAELLDSNELCEKLSINARKTYEDRYHIRHMKQRYQELIELL